MQAQSAAIPVHRQFGDLDPSYSGTKIRFDVTEFEAEVNKIYLQRNKELKPGYAPFCKHIFVPNFAGQRMPHPQYLVPYAFRRPIFAGELFLAHPSLTLALGVCRGQGVDNAGDGRE